MSWSVCAFTLSFMHSEQKSKIHVNWFILILFHSSSSLHSSQIEKKTKFPREISDEALKSQANTAEVHEGLLQELVHLAPLRKDGSRFRRRGVTSSA